MSRILVLDGHSAAALSVTRSAGQAGCWVAVGANEGLFAASTLSRYCSVAFDYPVSTEFPGSFVNSIREFVHAQAIDLVVPVTDWTLGPLSAERESFTGICKVAMPSQTALDFASDKHRTLELAKSFCIDVPVSRLVESFDDLRQLKDTQFPLVVKDRFSVRWIGKKAVFGTVSYAYSMEELERKVEERLRAAGDVLLQNFVSGVGIGFSCFVAGGQAFVPFQWERVREVDPRGSGSSARKSMPLDPILAARSIKLITEMGFEGIAMVEYKKTADGRHVLMEVNARPWGSIGLPVACGIDYPRYLIEWWTQGTLPPLKIAYPDGLLCRRLLGELTHLSNIRRGRPPNWPGRYPNFWLSLFAMALPWRPGMCYDDLWLSDLRPGIAGIRNWFRSRIRHLS